ncbi:MAG TPA: DUF309 domain-containing protein [Streptosporangiaceae bacterium]
MDRDRDSAGRPRNARARDALGRPLPRGTEPVTGESRIPDDLVLPPAEAVRLADELLRAGRPFHAHEVLEASWKNGPGEERDLWQGLAQIAVGLTHAGRGNARGAATLLRRGAQRVGGFDDRYGMDINQIAASAAALADEIAQHGLSGLSTDALRPGLLART